MKNLSNKVALVVGASGGIGSAIVGRLCGEGMKVVMSARNRERLEKTAESLKLAAGSYAILPADGSSFYHVEKLFKDIKKRFKRLDLVIISSGGYESLGLEATLKEASGTFQKLVGTNLVAAFHISYAAAAIMKKQGRGLIKGRGIIINISSHAATKVLHSGLAYGPTKAAARSLMLHLAKELAPHGVRVYDIQPSTVNTPEMSRFIPEGKRDLAVQPEEIAEKVVYLATHDVKEVNQPVIGKLPDF